MGLQKRLTIVFYTKQKKKESKKMYAISFDLETNKLKNLNDYPALYQEVNNTLTQLGFINKQGSVYIGETANLTAVYKAINALKSIDNFNKTVRDIRAFKVEDYSNFNEVFDNSKDNID